ncbi:multidrug effflux MFS transporter [Nitratireductor rhodophyticola]|uniref:Bcr/CflA family efflux transporter n=1 Tax=Nitratireductor rhodophyticola TaxID=2854036 RepID=A0ABS7R298_9HYPH|nr:multidrug effflux MFS transporter [Nitratireductor rhodophyticola]MBY8915064.1 multidrug effflux MFS transporter [Nitratireductor rhodophyticola]MBY8919866.1 multidrug effflux MFS transporter [Nitratireductor rhodophyticola]WPZ13830.1 multidrug effflux MFS transporter [Nitratireductor rhodophyticola]
MDKPVSDEALQPQKTLGRAEFIALAAALMSLNALAIDIMLPALQQIGAELGVDDENARQYIVTAYLAGLGGGQLIFGPISDRFGRRAPLFVGLALYVSAALIAAISPSFAVILALRFLQGIGAATTRVIAVSAIRDVFGGRQMAEVLSMVMMVFMVIPVIAPSIGQLIMIFGDWSEIFIAMAVLAIVFGTWAAIRLPETLAPENRRELTFSSVTRGFGYVLTNRIALCYTLATTSIFGSLFGFISSAQQIYTDTFDLADWFPILFAIGAGLMAISSFTNSRLVGRIGMRRLSHTALVGFTAVSLLWLVLASIGYMPFALFFVLFSVAMFQFGWVGANFNSIAMEPLGHVAGTAAATQGFLTTLGGGLIGAFVGQMFDGSTVPLAAGYFITGSIAIVLVLIGERGRMFHAVNPPV